MNQLKMYQKSIRLTELYEQYRMVRLWGIMLIAMSFYSGIVRNAPDLLNWVIRSLNIQFDDDLSVLLRFILMNILSTGLFIIIIFPLIYIIAPYVLSKSIEESDRNSLVLLILAIACSFFISFLSVLIPEQYLTFLMWFFSSIVFIGIPIYPILLFYLFKPDLITFKETTLKEVLSKVIILFLGVVTYYIVVSLFAVFLQLCLTGVLPLKQWGDFGIIIIGGPIVLRFVLSFAFVFVSSIVVIIVFRREMKRKELHLSTKESIITKQPNYSLLFITVLLIFNVYLPDFIYDLYFPTDLETIPILFDIFGTSMVFYTLITFFFAGLGLIVCSCLWKHNITPYFSREQFWAGILLITIILSQFLFSIFWALNVDYLEFPLLYELSVFFIIFNLLVYLIIYISIGILIIKRSSIILEGNLNE